jgi:hypothetical protein
MKKLAAGLATLALTITINGAPNVEATTAKPTGPCTGYGVNRQMDHDVIHHRMHALIRCAFGWVGIDDAHAAQQIVDRESGHWPWATNPAERGACHPWSGSSYGSCGLGQHLSRYWAGRVQTFLKASWFPKSWPRVSPLHARANALVTARMWKAQGGACPAWC